jgi:hypothetical protein
MPNSALPQNPNLTVCDTLRHLMMTLNCFASPLMPVLTTPLTTLLQRLTLRSRLNKLDTINPIPPARSARQHGFYASPTGAGE